MIINGQEIEVYTLNDDGQEVDRAVDFGKNPDALPTENSEVGVKSGGVFTAIKNAKETLERQIVNRNLLHNPYFRIDQRQGYVVPPNKNYYSDTSLTTLVGQTSEYVTVTAKASGYNTINIGGTNYYVAVADCVRGYIATAGNTYTNDRWAVWAGGNSKVLILNNSDGSITIRRIGGTPQTDNFTVYQRSSPEETANARGKTVTISVNSDLGDLVFQHNIPSSGNTDSGYKRIKNYWYMQFSISGNMMGTAFVGYYVPLNDEITVYGTKLEHGSISTLQAEMDSGNYNEDADLRECKKHYRPQSTSTVQGSYTEGFLFELCLTNLGMRIKPNVDTSHQQKVYLGSWVDVTYNYSEGDGDTLVIKYTMGSYPNDYRLIQFLFVPALSADL